MNFEKGTVKYLIVETIAIAIFGIILFPLLDFVLCKFFTNSEFEYSIVSHIIDPIVLACVCGVISWLIEKNRKGK